MEHSVRKDGIKMNSQAVRSVWGGNWLLCKVIRSPSVKEFTQRLSNHSALKMLYRKLKP